MLTKHLYIHIPFCKNICSYCDFFRMKMDPCDENIKKYIELVKEMVAKESFHGQYETIYLGGGTPNFLSHIILNDLLGFLSNYLNKEKEYEFTIECNPEFLNHEQAMILQNNYINRVSIGVQTTNDQILSKLNRQHSASDAQEAVSNLHSVGIENISCDFIYALEDMNEEDIIDVISFCKKNDIKHISYYALEVKEGSFLAKQDFVVDEEVEANQLEYIASALELNGYKRYEVSNWCTDKKYESKHNKAYWLTSDWKAIGIGASGFENQTIYKYEGTLLNWKKVSEKLTTADYYLQILMMGLRLVEGIEVVKNKRNAEAYATFFDDIVHCTIVNHHLVCRNLNLLHETLVNIVDETKEKQLKNISEKVFDESN
ncbi:MAG: radical SAM family heme chaperone HemW [Mycoplasma sp.]